MKDFLETIGQILFDADINDKKIINDLDTIKSAYVLIQWPESQDYMEEEWFEKEAILDVEGRLGDSAYFIPIKYIIK